MIHTEALRLATCIGRARMVPLRNMGAPISPINIGDAKSLATHPASTTHRQLSPDEMAKASVTAETVRLSIAIELVENLKADLDQALAAA